MALTINTEVRQETGKEVTYFLEGNLDNSTASNLEHRLNISLGAKPQVLVFNLAGLKYVTSAGLRLFVLAVKRQREHGGQVSFVNLQPQIKEVFAIMGNLPDARIFQNDAELDEYLIKRQNSYQ